MSTELAVYPIKGHCYVTQSYGLTSFAKSSLGRSYYKNFPGGIHPGYDFGTKRINLPIVSLGAGKVVKAKYDGGWGWHLEILWEDGWRRQYAHLSAIFVKVGDEVTFGQELGRVGSTGAGTAIHLHYGNRRWNKYRWEYRDPSADFKAAPEEPALPTGKLIKEDDPTKRAVFIYNGAQKFPLPDWDTKVFLFGEGSDDIELVEPDVMSKIPQGAMMTSLK